jgi:hypothetical protein
MSATPGAMDHAGSFLKSTVGEHYATATFVMCTLVVIILFLIYKLSQCHSAAALVAAAATTKSSFGNNPQWWHGGADAGSGGSLDRDITRVQASAYLPHLRDGFCPPGYGAAMVPVGNGQYDTKCVPLDARACDRPWDATASIEAVALGSVGALERDSYGEQRLQAAVEGHALDETQLSALLANHSTF